LLLSAACGPPPDAAGPPPRPAVSPPAPVAPPPDVLSGPPGAYHSIRFDLRLPLPDSAGWRVEDAREPWLSATHAASSTSLLVRTWRPDDRASRAACEAQARLWRDLPGGEGAVLVERRRIDVPAGFDTAVEIGIVAPARAGLPVEGFAVAFGGWARRCFAYVVTTRAAGPEAERAVAGRLAAMVEVSLAGVRLESDLSPAIPRRGPR
jgi:hypothetical protein